MEADISVFAIPVPRDPSRLGAAAPIALIVSAKPPSTILTLSEHQIAPTLEKAIMQRFSQPSAPHS